MNESSALTSSPDPALERRRQCVVLVGGMGTRLGNIVNAVPKPMLDIGGEPFLAHLLREIARFGYSRFLLLAGYRAEAVEEYFSSHSSLLPPGATVETMIESTPLGTGGALKAAAEKLDDSFLLCNGDSICVCDFSRASQPFRHPDTVMRMLLRPIAMNTRYGEVSLRNGLVDGFHARTTSATPSLMNIGVYGVRKELLNYIPAGKSSLESEVFPALTERKMIEGEDIGDSYFIDIGIPEDLLRARSELVPLLRSSAET